jgi:nicotinic acid mononucleotide adenylyltransferase/nicotinamide mononucleotide (NMN) deamidase PncC
MHNEELIKAINESDTYGTFVETGAGCPVANEIFQISGASKTIYGSTSPYCKELQEAMFGVVTRSVSPEFCAKVIQRIELDAKSGCNTVYVSSFQIADKPGMITHGWIGLNYKGIIKAYHITITSQTERARIIQLIGSIGLRILFCKNDMIAFSDMFQTESAMYSCIDIIMDDLGNSYIEEAIQQCDNGLNNHVTIDKDGHLIRLEDVLRKGDLIMMKGSFNPAHNHHLEILQATMKAYPTATPVFAISLDTYDKGHLNVNNVVGRVKMLNKLGYTVIIMRKGLFAQNTYSLRNHRHFANKIIFPMGTDTLNRLIVHYDKFEKMEKEKNVSVESFNAHFENVEFPYMVRPGIPALDKISLVTHFKSIGNETSDESSTTVRDLYGKGDYEAIKKMIPKEIHEMYFEFMKGQILQTA